MRLGRLVRGAGLGVVDQGLASLTPFVSSILVARSLPPDDFGFYSLSYAAVIFAIAVYQGFVIDPMIVHARSRGRRYLATVAGAVHPAWSGLLALAIGGVAFGLAAAYGRPAWGPAAAAALCLLGTSGTLLARRLQYANGRPGWSLAVSFAYLAGTVAVLLALEKADALGVTTALGAIGVVGVALSAVTLVRAGLGHGPEPGTWAEHMRFGLFSAGSNLLSWVPVNLQFYVLAAGSGLASAAEMRAWYMLVLPAQLGLANAAYVLIPEMAEHPAWTDAGRKPLRLLTGLAVVLGLLYGGFLAVAGPTLSDLIYHGQYPVGHLLIGLFGLAVCGSATHVAISSALRARNLPQTVLQGYAYGLPVVALGAGAAFALGTLGGILAVVVSYAAISAVTWVLLARLGPPAPAPPPASQAEQG